MPLLTIKTGTITLSIRSQIHTQTENNAAGFNRVLFEVTIQPFTENILRFCRLRRLLKAFLDEGTDAYSQAPQPGNYRSPVVDLTQIQPNSDQNSNVQTDLKRITL